MARGGGSRPAERCDAEYPARNSRSGVIGSAARRCERKNRIQATTAPAGPPGLSSLVRLMAGAHGEQDVGGLGLLVGRPGFVGTPIDVWVVESKDAQRWAPELTTTMRAEPASRSEPCSAKRHDSRIGDKDVERPAPGPRERVHRRQVRQVQRRGPHETRTGKATGHRFAPDSARDFADRGRGHGTGLGAVGLAPGGAMAGWGRSILPVLRCPANLPRARRQVVAENTGSALRISVGGRGGRSGHVGRGGRGPGGVGPGIGRVW